MFGLLGSQEITATQWPAPTPGPTGLEVYGAPSVFTFRASVQSPTGAQRSILPDNIRHRDARALVGTGAPAVVAGAIDGDAPASRPATQIALEGHTWIVVSWETYPAHFPAPATFEGVIVRVEPGDVIAGGDA